VPQETVEAFLSEAARAQESEMPYTLDLRDWLSHALHYHFATEIGVITAIGLVSLAVAHLVRKD
jgi:hypothetical protein